MKKNDKYSQHFLMNKEDVKEYCVQFLKFFEEDEELQAEEIGDGNINYVFKVKSLTSGKSIVIKQADRFLRSSGRPLDMYRNKIEADILAIEGQLAPGYVPEIYHYHPDMYALAMEDISSYKNLRKEMFEGKTFPDFAEHISHFLAKTLLPTTDLVMDRHEKKEKVKAFTNVELCDISEDLVFTEPYDNYKNRNIVTKGMEDFVNDVLYQDEQLKAEVGILRNQFMNNAQALIHGDLHSGSIFINDKGLKVIDPEFAFYGPMGYDIGNVIGNLFFALAHKMCVEPQCTEFIEWVEKTIEKTFDYTMTKIQKEYEESVTCSLYHNDFQIKYLAAIKADSLGYAGTEIIRRTVGDSQVLEVTAIEDLETRIKIDRLLIKLGTQLIKRRHEIKTGKEMINLLKEG